MNVTIAPDLLTLDDYTRAIVEAVDRRPDVAQGAQAIVTWHLHISELHLGRALLWQQLGDDTLDAGTDGHLVDAAWRCAEADRGLARDRQTLATRWTRQVMRDRRAARRAVR